MATDWAEPARLVAGSQRVNFSRAARSRSIGRERELPRSPFSGRLQRLNSMADSGARSSASSGALLSADGLATRRSEETPGLVAEYVVLQPSLGVGRRGRRSASGAGRLQKFLGRPKRGSARCHDFGHQVLPIFIPEARHCRRTQRVSQLSINADRANHADQANRDL